MEGFLILLGGLILVLILSLVWQRKGLRGQQKALSHIDESLALSRRAVELNERLVELAEESIRNQHEMIQLLGRDTARRWLERSDST